MRYGNPSIASRHRGAAAHGCERILLVPLYPQYAAATTATVVRQGVRRADDDALAAGAARRAALLRRSGLYRGAGAARSRRSWRSSPFKPEVILASFHGMPKDYLDKGDPYHCHCARDRAAAARAARPGRAASSMLTFQSRFGRAEWLQPYTDKTVEALAQERREEPRGRHAGLLRRLPGDAGGDRGRERAISSKPTAARISPRSPASTTARPACGDRACGAARAARLDRPLNRSPARIDEYELAARGFAGHLAEGKRVRPHFEPTGCPASGGLPCSSASTSS